MGGKVAGLGWCRMLGPWSRRMGQCQAWGGPSPHWCPLMDLGHIWKVICYKKWALMRVWVIKWFLLGVGCRGPEGWGSIRPRVVPAWIWGGPKLGVGTNPVVGGSLPVFWDQAACMWRGLSRGSGGWAAEGLYGTRGFPSLLG